MQKEVYLTFDDGIVPGTEEVLLILKKNNISATFFLTGINSYQAYQKNEIRYLEVLSDIFNNHLTGNHSFSHANNQYSSYYSNGLLDKKSGNSISVADDFRNNVIFFSNYLNSDSLFSGEGLGKRLARLPGRNAWYVDRKLAVDGARSVVRINYSSEIRGAVEQLMKDGYEIFGWDVEWTGNIDGDRLESPVKVGDKILTTDRDKVIVLMHDSAFRKRNHDSGTGMEEADKLNDLIVYLKRKDVIFKTLDNY
jgi:peptidoglycan/xylan/chitin deacetylase (PgdA/CDA1 family)